MAENAATSQQDQLEIDDEGLLREVSDAALSKLAHRLGKDWRAFLRGELGISQLNIEEIECEPHLTVAERIYRLLRLWKTTSEEKPTISCLISHLKSFGYSTDTWEMLTKGTGPLLTTSAAVSVCKSRPEPPYHKAHAGGSRDFVPQFCYVVEATEDLNLQSFQGVLYYPEGTKFDVVDVTRMNVLLARDIEGNIVQISRTKCQQVQFHTPILWENSWFHEEVTRNQLERIFCPYEKGSFLFRESSENGFFALSVKDTSTVKNFKIKCTETGYILSERRHFYTLTDLISCYKGTWIFTTEEGRLFLCDYVPKSAASDLKSEDTELKVN